MSHTEAAPSRSFAETGALRAIAANAVRQVHGAWPATCGGAGTRRSSISSAISIRSAGGSSTTTRSRCSREFTPERLEMRAAELVLYSRINHAYRRLKEYLANTHTWGRTHAGVLGSQAGGLLLGRVRHPRIGADLLRRPGRALGRPHQERQRPGRAAGGHRPVLRPGLFQAAPRRRRLAARRVSRHEGREPADGAGPRRPTASRSPSRSTPAPASCWPRSG